MAKGRRPVENSGYRGPQTCKVVGITYRQLDYWTRTGLVTPSIQEATGSGSQRLYSFNDLLQLKVVKSLTDAGASLQKVRQAIEYVRNHLEDDWSKVTIVTDGGGVYACTSDAEVVDLLRSGQGVLGAIVAVGKVRDQLAGTLRELRPATAETGYRPGDVTSGRVPGATRVGDSRTGEG
jgi:DNA-binding transcriptional MerR regulator